MNSRIFQLILVFALCSCVPTQVFANGEVVEGLQNQIQDSQSVIQDLEKEISQYQQQLNQISGERRTLETAVKELDTTDKKIQATIKSTTLKIDDTEKNIKNLDFTIGELEERIDRNKYLVVKYIQEINYIESKPVAFAVLHENDLTSILQAASSYNRLQYVFNREVGEFRLRLEELGATKRTKEEEKIKFENLVEEHAIEKKSIEQNKKQKTVLLTETKSEESEYQKIVNEKIALKKEFEDSLQDLESQLKYILDPTSYPEPQFGIFGWPLKYVLITQPFGLTADSAKLYSYRTGAWSGRHTGLDFRASNDNVYALGSGTVVDFGNTDLDCPRASFGGWMLIHYDNGLSSIYSHLTSFTASKGQRVTNDTIVAISGNTGYSTGPHLDIKIVPTDAVSVETWPSKGCPGKNYRTPLVAGSTYFDPLGYLPRATESMFK